MINFHDVTKEILKGHKANGLQIPDHPYRILIRGYDSGSVKTNILLNLIRD